jgi:hypothetical protein
MGKWIKKWLRLCQFGGVPGCWILCNSCEEKKTTPIPQILQRPSLTIVPTKDHQAVRRWLMYASGASFNERRRVPQTLNRLGTFSERSTSIRRSRSRIDGRICWYRMTPFERGIWLDYNWGIDSAINLQQLQIWVVSTVGPSLRGAHNWIQMCSKAMSENFVRIIHK